MGFARFSAGVAALACVAAGALGLASGALAATPGGSPSATRNAASTRAFIASDLRYGNVLLRHAPAERAAAAAFVKRVAIGCPKVLEAFPRRLTDLQQQGALEFLMDTALSLVVDAMRPARPDIERVSREMQRLPFSDPGLAWSVHVYALSQSTLPQLAVPDLCADARALVHSHYIDVTAAGRRFLSQASRVESAAPSDAKLIAMMRPYAPAAVTTGLQRRKALERRVDRATKLNATFRQLGRTLFGNSWARLLGSPTKATKLAGAL